MNRSILWRSALVQLLTVAVLFALLALLLPHSFFEHWGWLVGPLAWLGCATVTAWALHLPRGDTLIGAVLSGLLSGIAVLIGIHTLGLVIAVGAFAAWCARGPSSRPWPLIGGR